jgi:hypothetical protein
MKYLIPTQMFSLLGQPLTWRIVRKWTHKDCDFNYDLQVLHQPVTLQDDRVMTTAHPHGKPFNIYLAYLVKGSELFHYAIKAGSDEEVEKADFMWSGLYKLDELDPETEILVEKLPPPFWSTDNRARLYGERFFMKPKESGFRAPAFSVRFRQKNSYWYWKEAQEFIWRLKYRMRQGLPGDRRVPDPSDQPEASA